MVGSSMAGTGRLRYVWHGGIGEARIDKEGLGGLGSARLGSAQLGLIVMAVMVRRGAAS